MKDLFLKIDDFLKSFNKKYVYCGSISLYLNGMNINNFDDIDVDFIDCIISYNRTTNLMSLKIKGTRFQHMGPLRLYKKDQIEELSDGKLKIYLYKNQKEPEVWIVECWGKK